MTLNLALKNICAANDAEKNNVTYKQCSWITQIADNANLINFFYRGTFYDIINVQQLQLIEVALCCFYKICFNYCDALEV